VGVCVCLFSASGEKCKWGCERKFLNIYIFAKAHLVDRTKKPPMLLRSNNERRENVELAIHLCSFINRMESEWISSIVMGGSWNESGERRGFLSARRSRLCFSAEKGFLQVLHGFVRNWENNDVKEENERDYLQTRGKNRNVFLRL
jgi:hypothetical protein